MGAGKYRHLVALEVFIAGVRSASGAPTGTWTPADNVWAEIEPVSLQALAGAREAVMGGANTAVDIVAITMRPYTGLTPLTWRVRYDGHVYDIKAVRPTNKRDEVVLLATVGAAGA